MHVRAARVMVGDATDQGHHAVGLAAVILFVEVGASLQVAGGLCRLPQVGVFHQPRLQTLACLAHEGAGRHTPWPSWRHIVRPCSCEHRGPCPFVLLSFALHVVQVPRHGRRHEGAAHRVVEGTWKISRDTRYEIRDTRYEVFDKKRGHCFCCWGDPGPRTVDLRHPGPRALNPGTQGHACRSWVRALPKSRGR